MAFVLLFGITGLKFVDGDPILLMVPVNLGWLNECIEVLSISENSSTFL